MASQHPAKIGVTGIQNDLDLSKVAVSARELNEPCVRVIFKEFATSAAVMVVVPVGNSHASFHPNLRFCHSIDCPVALSPSA